MTLSSFVAATIAVGVALSQAHSIRSDARGSSPSRPAAEARPQLAFVENTGQVDAQVSYYLRTGPVTAYFAADGVTYTLPAAASDRRADVARRNVRPALASSPERRRQWAIKLDFVGAEPVAPHGLDQTETVVHYLIGDRAQWQPPSRTYRGIGYSELWPGIDLVYGSAERRLKYSFIVQPHADPGRIKLRYRGVSSVEVTREGRLAVATPFTTIYEEPPFVYQDIDGRRVEVDARYVIDAVGTPEDVTYGFELGAYRRDLPLVLDPFIAYAGYVGDDDIDVGHGIAVDSTGAAYVVGHSTASSTTSFPETVGVADSVITMDAFVAKVVPSGASFAYVTYIGGLSHDIGYGIAVAGDGTAYVSGYTSSPNSFPHGLGFAGVPSFDATYNGGFADAFVARLSADGSTLLYAGFIGGADEEAAFGIALDFFGNAYVAGGTCSDQTSFPDGDGFGVLTGPDITFNGGDGGGEYYCDGFVAKVSAAGDQLLNAGYIGGSSYDEVRGVAVEPGGRAYLIGSTGSNEASFPDVLGPDKTYNGGGDAFVAKLKTDFSGLQYSGYLGGGGKDDGNGIALRRDLVVTGYKISIVYTALVTGATETNAIQFPAVVGPDTTHNGFYDAFVARVNSSGTGLLFSGFIGGSGYDIGNGIAVDADDYAYIVGATSSDQATFPVKSGPDTTYNGNGDAFVAGVRRDGTGLIYATYIGGHELDNPNILDDFGTAIDVDGLGNVYITGNTFCDSSTFPDGNGFGILGGPNAAHAGSTDAFVVKLANFIIAFPWRFFFVGLDER